MSNLSNSLSKLLLRWKFNSYDQYASLYKSPVNSRIVVFSPYANFVDSILNKALKGYSRVDVQDLSSRFANDDDLTDAVARSLNAKGKLSAGNLVYNFPRNTVQASRLDAILDGVNLAINITFSEAAAKTLTKNYLECVTCGKLYNSEFDLTAPQQPGTTEKCEEPTKCNLVEGTKNLENEANEYNTQYRSVLDYYQKRGTLLNFQVEPSWSIEETRERLEEEILSSIKL